MGNEFSFTDTGIVKTVAVGDTLPTYIRAAVEFKLLNSYLSATIENHEDGSVELLIQPQCQYNAQPFTLVQLLDGINSLFKGLAGDNAIQLSADTIFAQMEKFLKNLNLDQMKISIQQVFLHVTKPKEGEASLEYAFSLKIEMSDGVEPKDFTFAELQSLAFGIWNTKNQRILSSMKLTSIAQQLS